MTQALPVFVSIACGDPSHGGLLMVTTFLGLSDQANDVIATSPDGVSIWEELRKGPNNPLNVPHPVAVRATTYLEGSVRKDWRNDDVAQDAVRIRYSLLCRRCGRKQNLKFQGLQDLMTEVLRSANNVYLLDGRRALLPISYLRTL